MKARQHRKARQQLQRRTRRGLRGPIIISAATNRMLKRLMAPRRVPFFANAGRAIPITAPLLDSFRVDRTLPYLDPRGTEIAEAMREVGRRIGH